MKKQQFDGVEFYNIEITNKYDFLKDFMGLLVLIALSYAILYLVAQYCFISGLINLQ